jgi:DNA-directed RNA polymerase sigma subunit (sigma70/sigma32)
MDSLTLDNKLESLEAYHLMADKLIAKFGQSWMYDDKYKAVLIQNLVKSDTEYKSNTGASRATYRFGGWKFARLKMLQMRRREKSLVSLNSSSDGNEQLYKTIAANTNEPVQELIENEGTAANSGFIDSILNNEVLSQVEKNYLKMIYKDCIPRNEIATMLGVTKQAVSFTEQKALRKLREVYVGNQ